MTMLLRFARSEKRFELYSITTFGGERGGPTPDLRPPTPVGREGEAEGEGEG